MEVGHIIVYITVPSREVGEGLARMLVGERLAACVNIVPGMTSIYSWEGEVEEDEELLLMVKTKSTLFERLSEAVQKAHPYEVPEVIGVPIVAGSKAYLDWIKAETKG